MYEKEDIPPDIECDNCRRLQASNLELADDRFRILGALRFLLMSSRRGGDLAAAQKSAQAILDSHYPDIAVVDGLRKLCDGRGEVGPKKRPRA